MARMDQTQAGVNAAAADAIVVIDLEQVNAAVANVSDSAARPGLYLRRLGQCDLPEIERHLLALDILDRHAGFGSAFGDAAIATYVRRIDLARAVLIGAVDAPSSPLYPSSGLPERRDGANLTNDDVLSHSQLRSGVVTSQSRLQRWAPSAPLAIAQMPGSMLRMGSVFQERLSTASALELKC